MENLKIAEIFSKIAKILEIKQDNPFRIRAYERAAQNLQELTEDVQELINQDRLTDIPGIGKDLSNKIKEIVSTGKLKFYEQLTKSIPPGLLDLLNIPSIGPKTAALLYQKLNIKSISDLEKSIDNNKLIGLFGIKEKTIDNIKQGLSLLRKGRERMNLAEAIQLADEFIKPLSELVYVKKISPAGSLRRQKETVRDIDILIVSSKPGKVMDKFTQLPQVKKIQAKGKTKSSVLSLQDAQVDCRVVADKSFGAALLYFTGSKNFNIKLRTIAIKKNYKINEYGVFAGKRTLAGRTEEEIFKLLKMSYIPAELREDAGEIELAQKDKLPNLVDISKIRADLHVHSDYSDGGNSIEEMAQAAKKRNYSYLAITDHSQSLKIAGGLSRLELKKKRKEIERINKKIKGFCVLYATEVDIDSEGRLDYPDNVLREFDLVVAAIHSGFKQSKTKLTQRLVRACQNRYTNIIAHPTGRLWGVRDAYELDFEQVFKTCRQTNTALEINAFPSRLDLNDINSRYARAAGVKLAIGSDAHSTDGLAVMKLGVSVARRAWLEETDLLNTLPLDKFLKTIKK
ncbi:MAG: DNA polymerase/3'-5' exonuclease PolX [Candidatus Omnitrophota bacterium]|jgi:DNA polymerase (family 10)